MHKEENEKKQPKTKLQKVLSIISTIAVVLVVIVAIFVVFITITAKKSPDGAMNVFGHQMRTILTGSMEECPTHNEEVECELNDVSDYSIGHLPIDTMIFVEVAPTNADKAEKWYAKIKKGDVLTFQYSGMGVVTHRVYSIEPWHEGGYKIVLKGDNCGGDGVVDSQVIYTHKTGGYDKVIGKVTGQNLFLGKVVTFIQKPYGAIAVIFVPCFIIMVVEIIKIISIVRASKKEKAEEKQKEVDQTQSDIEELKRQIELTKQSMGISDTAVSSERIEADEQTLELSEQAEEIEQSSDAPINNEEGENAEDESSDDK